jgi:hypothetical protein
VILDQETLTWYSADAPPDADTTVLVFAPGCDEPVWLGYFDGDSWFEIGGAEYGNAEELADHVTAWAPLPAAASIPDREIKTMAEKKCGKCGSNDLTPGGGCRACKKASNAAYRAKKSGAAAPAAGTRKRRAKSVPLQLQTDRMVIMQFAIRIEDSGGTVHDLFLTGETVKRLAIELQEFA